MQDKYDLDIDIGITDLNKNKSSQKVIDHIKSQPNVKIKHYELESGLVAEVSSGKLVAGIIIAPDTLRIVGDPSRQMWIEFLKPIVEVATLEPTNSTYAINTEFVNSRNLRFFDFLFPGILIFSIMQVGLSGGIMLLVQRKNGSLKRLQITPLKKWEFLLGYVACYLCIMLLQAGGYIVLAKSLFNYSFSGSSLDVITVIVISSALFVLLGILLCNFCETVENGNNFNRLFIFPASFLCGVFIPIASFPVFFQKLALIHPLTYLVDLMRNIANYNSTLLDYKAMTLSFIALIIAILIISSYTFKWKEKI